MTLVGKLHPSNPPRKGGFYGNLGSPHRRMEIEDIMQVNPTMLALTKS
jgi:hypothetical protein